MSNEAIWKHICNGFRDVHEKRGVGQLADALIRFDLSKQAKQARQARQRSGQMTGNQTLHLCMFQRPRAIKHYTCACLSACGAPNITPMHVRALKPHLDRQWQSESTFGHGCTVSEFQKHRPKAHLDTVARFQNVTRLSGCTVPEFGPEGALAMIPIMTTKPKGDFQSWQPSRKRCLNHLELRLCMFGAAQTLWSYACACLVLRKCCSNALELRLCMFGAPQDIKACNKSMK